MYQSREKHNHTKSLSKCILLSNWVQLWLIVNYLHCYDWFGLTPSIQFRNKQTNDQKNQRKLSKNAIRMHRKLNNIGDMWRVHFIKYKWQTYVLHLFVVVIDLHGKRSIAVEYLFKYSRLFCLHLIAHSFFYNKYMYKLEVVIDSVV